MAQVDITASMLEVLREALLAEGHSTEEVDALVADAKHFMDHLVVVVLQYVHGNPIRTIPAMCGLQWLLTFLQQDIKPGEMDKALEAMRRSATATSQVADSLVRQKLAGSGGRN